MSTIALTDLSIRSLKCETRTDYWDAKTPGFGIRVGRRTKVFIAKVANRRHTLGVYPKLSLADARRKALSLKSEDEPVIRSKITFEQAYEKFKADHVAGKRPRTQHDYKRVLDKYFLPELAKTRLVTISYEKITGITDKLSETPSERAHALAVARTFFKWCARPPRRYAPSPLEGLQLKIAKPRKRTLSNEEIIKIWLAAEAQGYPHGTVVQLLLLTGQRRGEIAALERPWINEKDRTITLPDTLTKSKREHTFPLGDLAKKVLEAAPCFSGTEFLFPTRWDDDRPFSGWSKYKSEMKDDVAGWTLHDLRRTFATRLAEMKVLPHIIERLLNHKMGGISNKTGGVVSAVAEVYNRATYLPEMREAITRWEAHIMALLAAHEITLAA
jgi:integrase